jgi:hypothetical protein
MTDDRRVPGNGKPPLTPGKLGLCRLPLQQFHQDSVDRFPDKGHVRMSRLLVPVVSLRTNKPIH